MRPVAIALLVLWPISNTIAQAPTMHLGARVGAFTYDAGGDSHVNAEVALERTVAPNLRVGLLGSWAHPGFSYTRPWQEPGTDEKVLRAALTLGYDVSRLLVEGSGNSRLRPIVTLGAGVVHSAGVITDFSAHVNDPFWGITNQRTGFSYGAGLTLEYRVVSNLLLTGSFHYWRDRLYGGQLDNFEKGIGLGFQF